MVVAFWVREEVIKLHVVWYEGKYSLYHITFRSRHPGTLEPSGARVLVARVSIAPKVGRGSCDIDCIYVKTPQSFTVSCGLRLVGRDIRQNGEDGRERSLPGRPAQVSHRSCILLLAVCYYLLQSTCGSVRGFVLLLCTQRYAWLQCKCTVL